MSVSKMERITVASIGTSPGLSPAHDERFQSLLAGSISGETPLYYAAVPLALCVPFDVDYRPDLHPAGAAAISEVREAYIQERYQKLFVYQRGMWFVVSDDYIILFAALTGLPDYVPCWVLGKPEGDLVRDVQGPVATEDVAKLLGF